MIIMSINELERPHRRRQRVSKPLAAVTPIRKRKPKSVVRYPGRRYLRRQDVRVRYGWQAVLSVDRAWKEYKTLPPPTTYQGRNALWDEAVLDALDAAHALPDSA
jgi:hypothetical protein